MSVVPARFYRPQKLVVFGLDAGESLAARLVASLLRRQVPFQTSSAGSETPAPRVRHPKRPRCFWRRVVAATTALHRRSNRGPRSRGAIPLADSPTAPPKVRSDKRQIRRAWCHHVRRCGPRLYDCHCCHQSPLFGACAREFAGVGATKSGASKSSSLAIPTSENRG